YYRVNYKPQNYILRTPDIFLKKEGLFEFYLLRFITIGAGKPVSDLYMIYLLLNLLLNLYTQSIQCFVLAKNQRYMLVRVPMLCATRIGSPEKREGQSEHEELVFHVNLRVVICGLVDLLRYFAHRSAN
ncbi:hypothetical protein ACJX0J_038191, partial [Zea mays]